MVIKTPVLEIGPGEKGKFAIKFSLFKKECEKKFVMFIQRDWHDFENILLKVNFVHNLPND